ncbi:hypothetical protein N0V83_004424 [Neocucurbitaria cava]|uniref:Uncharacterized protein n=1 Tax=Neocucurbitaria cava TaxID=798079 RepID=A0A9W8Y8J0_9PLEO|nr:hypothetical protein N0V83_004424 [Neocucurbitaria cava]
MSDIDPTATAAVSHQQEAVVSHHEGNIERTVQTTRKRQNNTVQLSVQDNLQESVSVTTATTSTEAQQSKPAGEKEDSELSEPEDSELSEPEDNIAYRAIRQQTLSDKETFAPHPTDATKIIATFRTTLPNDGGEFVQIDEIPELSVVPTGSADDKAKSYFLPPLGDCKVPRQRRASKRKARVLWVEDKAAGNWTRTDGNKIEVFKPTIVFRRFKLGTHEYEGIHVCENKLENVDPNNKTWMYSYNKWIDQITRRRDDAYEQKLKRTHWTVPEKRALYTEINAFCRASGLFRFGFGKEAGMTTEHIQGFANAVNRVGGNNRNTDSVRSQFTSAHAGKNKEILDLIERAEALRVKQKENTGVKLSQKERFPFRAIPLSAFPTEADETKAKAKKNDNKRKAEAIPVKSSRKRKSEAFAVKYEDSSPEGESSPTPSLSSRPSRTESDTESLGDSELADDEKEEEEEEQEKEEQEEEEQKVEEEQEEEEPQEVEEEQEEEEQQEEKEKEEVAPQMPGGVDDGESERSTLPPSSPMPSPSHKRKRSATPKPPSPPPMSSSELEVAATLLGLASGHRRDFSGISPADSARGHGWRQKSGWVNINGGESGRPVKKARPGKAAAPKRKNTIDGDGDLDISDLAEYKEGPQ